MIEFIYVTGVFYAILLLFLIAQVILVISGLFLKEKNTVFMPPITVLIPTYNDATIEKTIMSVLNDPYPTKEIIVIDDGSTIPFQTKLPVTVLRVKHGGKVHALNAGLKKATHEIIVTIDADTQVNSSLHTLVAPMKDESVGAVTASADVQTKGVLAAFQKLEYNYISLIRRSFSKLFSQSVWFFGFYVAYRKSALTKVKGFSTDTVTEDMDISLTLMNAGYKVLTSSATGITQAPTTLPQYFRQRTRWWQGGLQNIRKHSYYIKRANFAVWFLLINQIWWTIFAFVAIPFTAYQFWYWFDPSIWYTLRWFNISGSLYVIYMLPQWGLGVGSFGVFAGLSTACLLLLAYKQSVIKKPIWAAIVIFFYFPYTLIHNIVIMTGFFKFLREKSSKFMK